MPNSSAVKFDDDQNIMWLFHIDEKTCRQLNEKDWTFKPVEPDQVATLDINELLSKLDVEILAKRLNVSERYIRYVARGDRENYPIFFKVVHYLIDPLIEFDIDQFQIMLHLLLLHTRFSKNDLLTVLRDNEFASLDELFARYNDDLASDEPDELEQESDPYA